MSIIFKSAGRCIVIRKYNKNHDSKGRFTSGGGGSAAKVVTVESVEQAINAAEFDRTSKDNNKNNQRIKAFLSEKYPDSAVEFMNDKRTGQVKVKSVKNAEEERQRREKWIREETARNQRAAKEEKYYARMQRDGTSKLRQTIENKLDKDGIEAIVDKSHSISGTMSFYVDGNGKNIKVSDHFTQDQRMQHPETYFIDIKHRTSTKEIYDEIKSVLTGGDGS